MPQFEKLYTIAEAAEALQVTVQDCANPERWLRNKVRELGLPYVKVARTVKLPAESVEALRASMLRSDRKPAQADIFLGESVGGRSALSTALLERLRQSANGKVVRRG